MEVTKEDSFNVIGKKNKKMFFQCIIIVLLAVILFLSYLTISEGLKPSSSYAKTNWSSKTVNASSKVLVLYVFANTHSLSLPNLEFFIRVAVLKCSSADYYIIIQKFNDTKLSEMKLPALPPYAHYVEHENRCFDLGTIGWFLSNGTIDKSIYRYFIFMNSSVRGPYLVSYHQLDPWYSVFTNRLNDYIKLVGPTISCQVSPHVQSYLWATDSIGLSILLKNGNVFACHKTQVDAIYQGEIPAGRILFNAGFTIDSLMKKYQGYDFHKGGNRDCFSMENPTSEKMVDGISLDPFEVVFVKLKFSTRDYLHTQSRIAAYDKWIGALPS